MNPSSSTDDPPVHAAPRRPAFLGRIAAAMVLAAVAGCASVAPPALVAASAPAEPVAEATARAEAPPPEPEVAAPEPEAEAVAEEPVELRDLLMRSRLDPLDDSARGDLWQRVRDGLAMPDLDGDLVRKWEQYYASRPDYVQRMTTRGSRYLFHIVEEIDRRGLPLDLALLPFIESAFDPHARSAARAAGMWQFMPGTGRDFELKQNLFRDDRRDVLASTRAALDYLQMLHRQFGDWHLALAAYNWGQGNVNKAIARNRAAGLPTDYASLRMPDETRNYVPKLQAVKNIVARPQEFAIVLPPLENHPYFIGVPIERDIDVALAARLAGLTLEQFQQLNPQLNKPVILAAATSQVLLPYDNANRFVRALETHRGARSSWTAWVAPTTLKPAEAARRVGMSEADLRAVNLIPPRMLVKAGSTLLVPRAAHSTLDVAERVAEKAVIALAPEARPATKRARHGNGRGKAVAAVRVAAAKTAVKPKARAAQVAAAKPAARKARPAPARVRVALR